MITENKSRSDEIESIERELHKMKSEMATSYLSSQQMLQKITIE